MRLIDLFKKNKNKIEVKISSPVELYIERLKKLYARSMKYGK